VVIDGGETLRSREHGCFEMSADFTPQTIIHINALVLIHTLITRIGSLWLFLNFNIQNMDMTKRLIAQFS